MHSMLKTGTAALFAAIALGATAGAVQAATLKITVTNLGASGGLTITPVFAAFHNGSFDTFNVGDAASPGLEEIAETGSAAGVTSEMAGVQSSAVSAFITAAGNGIPPIEPGESDSATLTLDGTDHRYFSYLSMILPSNDHFIGNGDPLAHALFDGSGNYLGDQSIFVLGTDAYDAGTEQNIGDGAPFVPSLAGTVGVDEGGTVHAATGVDNFAGLEVANGQTIDLSQINFAGNPDYQIARIDIQAVPVPAALPLMLGAFGLMGFAARRRNKGA